MGTRHTPGPWSLYDPEAYGDRMGIDSDYDSIILFGDESNECGVLGRDYDEALANAKLIAAAPELLEACERAIETLEERGTTGRAKLLLSNAIKKATE